MQVCKTKQAPFTDKK